MDPIHVMADHFNVNMGGFYGNSTEEMILNEMASKSYTGWELRQLQEAGRLPEVQFYRDGAGTEVPNPSDENRSFYL